MKYAAKSHILFILLFSLASVVSRGDTNFFKGSIVLDSSISKTPLPAKVNVTVNVISKIPVDGQMTNTSHIEIDPTTSKKSVVCEYHYSFSPSQMTIALTTENGNTLGGATVNINVAGTIYTDPTTPDANDLTQCSAPSADTFPVSGPMDVTLDTLNNFQLSDNVLLSLDPGKQIFKNTGTIDLKNRDVNVPQLTNLTIDSLSNMTWTAFGKEATTTSGAISFTTAASE